MNGIKYAEWASYYDPNNLEIKMLSALGINFKRKRVLEIGSGTGRFTKRIINDCDEITCIDPDADALSVLRDSISSKKVRVICGTLESVKLKLEHYDYVVFPWSMYLIANREEVLSLSKEYLKPNGGIIVLQAMSGEYEEEISKLYRSYNSLAAYSNACDTLPADIKNMFGNVTSNILTTYFEFDSIAQVIDCSLFFVEDEEGQPPLDASIDALRERLKSYVTATGKVVMTDLVSVITATRAVEKKELEGQGGFSENFV